MTLNATFTEPTAHLPLRYGTHRARYIAALALLFGGGILLQFTSAYTLLFAITGFAASAAGWIVIPGKGWRRQLALLTGLLGVAGLLNGAASGVLLALTLAGWLLVRQRPLLSYLVIALPAITALRLGDTFPQYGAGLIVVTALGSVMIGSAWIARAIAQALQGLRLRRTQHNRPDRTLK